MNRHLLGLAGYLVASTASAGLVLLVQSATPAHVAGAPHERPVARTTTRAPRHVPYERARLQLAVDSSHCFVQCPEFTLQIDGDGTARFEGLRNTRVVGPRSYSIASADVQALVDEAYRIRFFSLGDQYVYRDAGNGRVTTIDHGIGYTLSVDTGLDQKSVYSYYGAPIELDWYIQRVMDTGRVHAMVGRTDSK
jgi:hypothetical protein